MKALLINPWIYDFACFNFWIRPLGLYRVAEWLWERGVEVSMIDCLSPFDACVKFPRVRTDCPVPMPVNLKRRFCRYGIGIDEFEHRLNNAGGFDVVFITSVMSYWYLGVIKVVELIRKRARSAPVVLGGVYASLWKDHAIRNSGADIVLSGSIEANALELYKRLSIPVSPVRPFKRWYEIGLFDKASYWAIRMATGCPFNCTYCGSRIISGPFRPMDWHDILNELSFLYKNDVKEIAFYDDALLVGFEDRLRPLLTAIKEKNMTFTFHTPNGLHARLLRQDVAAAMKEANFKTIRLSLETVSPIRQELTGGKVNNEELKEAVFNLLGAGVDRDSIGVYLLIGLIDQDIEEIRESIMFVKSLGIRAYLAEFSPIPNTLEWQKLIEKGVIDENLDPIYTNNTVFFRLFSKITEAEWNELNRLRL